MKNKLLAIMAVFGMVASASAVKINNNLSINGFIDGSFKLVDNETGADDQGLDADEAELNFVLSNGAVSGLISVDTQEADGTSDLDIEQALLLRLRQWYFPYLWSLWFCSWFRA